MIEKNDPISPLILRQVSNDGYRIATQKDINSGQFLKAKMGLTIRQEFAARAMQGLLVNKSLMNQMELNGVIQMSIMAADTLIEELNK